MALENLLYKTKTDFFKVNLKLMSLKDFNKDKVITDEENKRHMLTEDLKENIQKWSEKSFGLNLRKLSFVLFIHIASFPENRQFH